MAVQLINLGTAANDGTGDTLRTAGQKMNANATELFGSIASFETTAQLDARDTANRTRANHTGTQAIGTVTGLQTALDAKLEAGALTGLTASDAAQDSAIAALILNDGVQDSAIASFETTAQLNARDAANRTRSNHTGTQSIGTITGLQAAVESFTARVAIVTEATYPAEPITNVLYVVLP